MSQTYVHMQSTSRRGGRYDTETNCLWQVTCKRKLHIHQSRVLLGVHSPNDFNCTSTVVHSHERDEVTVGYVFGACFYVYRLGFSQLHSDV